MLLRRALVVGQDNVLMNCPNIDTDFISTGKSFTPGALPPPDSAVELMSKMLVALRRVATRKYDYVILPSVHLSWIYDNTAKRHLRSLLRNVLSLRVTSQLLHRAFQGPRVAFLDRYDSPDIYPELPEALGADIYFKANLRAGVEMRFPFKVQVLPYWIFENYYPDSLAEKKVDLFYCATTNSESRKSAIKELALLAKHGFSIDHPTERIPFSDFVTRMGQATLTLSPSGYGYNGFRNYEAMLMKSIPVVNKPQEPIQTDMVDGYNCITYDAQVEGDLTQSIATALRGGAQFHEWGGKVRQFALDNHSVTKVGNYLIDQLQALSPDPR